MSRNQTWRPVSGLERGKVYRQGNVGDFVRMTGWGGSRVLYFGDHVFSDLAVSVSNSAAILLYTVYSAYHFMGQIFCEYIFLVWNLKYFCEC